MSFFSSLEAVQAEIDEPLEEIAEALAADKCGDCYACCAGYHEQCKGPNYNWHEED